MKKILLLSLCLLSLLALTSCGKDDNSSTQSGSTFTLKGSGT